MSRLFWLTPMAAVAMATAPLTTLYSAAQSSAVTSGGAATILVEANGAVQSAAALSGGAIAVRVDGTGAHQSAPAQASGTGHTRVLIAGVMQSRPAMSGGVVKPPSFQTAVMARSGQVHIVELDALQRAATRTALRWVMPLASVAMATAPENSTTSQLVTFRFSDTGYSTPNSGTYANTHFDARVIQPLSMTRTLPVAPESARRVALELGAITLVNIDGSLDGAAKEFAVDGRDVRVLIGLENTEYDDFTPVFSGVATAWVGGFGELTVDIRDKTYRLDTPLHPETYGGTGGYDGPESLAGQPRPVCFGVCKNISPLAVDPANLVWQFHHRAAQAVDAVYDRRSPLTFDADYADYAALIAATLSAGKYATCLAKGLIRVETSPTRLTADVRGDAYGSYINTTSAIAQRMITGYGPFAVSDLDAVAWAALETARSGVIGLYLPDPLLISDAVSRVMSGAYAWWGAGFSGLLTSGILGEPDAANVAWNFGEVDVRDIERIAAPTSTFPPRFRQRVGYARNYTVMTGSDIAGIAEADKAFVKQDYRFVDVANETTRTEFLTSQDPDPLPSLFDGVSDASLLANELLNLLSVPRQTIKITVGLTGYVPKFGATVRLTHPRILDNQGWLARVIDHDIRAANREITLVLWG